MKYFVNGMDSNIWGIRSQMWVTQKSRKPFLQNPRSGNWCKTSSSMKTWKRLKEIHGCLLRGFARTPQEITKQRTIRMLFRTCWLRAKLWGAIRVWKSTFWRPTWIFFSQKISANSVTNRWKIPSRQFGYGKAIPRQVDFKYVGRILQNTEEGSRKCAIPFVYMKLGNGI